MRLEIDATPAAFTLDTERSALLVIDMQNDFGAAGGMFARAGIDIAPIRAVVAPIARVAAAARRAKLPVVFVQMGYGPDLAELGPPGSPNRERHLAFGAGEDTVAPGGRPSRVLVRDTWNTAIVDELAPETGDLAIWNHEASLLVTQALFGWVTSSAVLLGALGAGQAGSAP